MLHVPAPHQEEADVIKRLRGVDISSSSIWKQCKCLASSVGQVGGSSQQRQINMRTTVERGGRIVGVHRRKLSHFACRPPLRYFPVIRHAACPSSCFELVN